MRSKPSKKGLCCRAGQGQGSPPARHADRDLVPGRGPDRADRADQKTIRGIVFPQDKITRRWAKRGTRPSAPHDQRTKSAYIFGAICPQEGKAAGLVLPFCNTDTMNLHLAEIALHVAPGAHAVLLMDQAGWHLTPKLTLPTNISIVAIPSKSPELNPQENVWQFMRDNWLSNRVFGSYDEIVDHCCDAWNKLVEQPWRIMSLGLRDWAHGS